MKQYLLAVLFNAPTTISNHYTVQANHDRRRRLVNSRFFCCPAILGKDFTMKPFLLPTLRLLEQQPV